MFITITLLTCLAGTCEKTAIPFDGSLMQCTLFGQQVAAEWMKAHPKRTFKGYRCTAEPIGEKHA
jgi:hypothetical protein